MNSRNSFTKLHKQTLYKLHHGLLLEKAGTDFILVYILVFSILIKIFPFHTGKKITQIKLYYYYQITWWVWSNYSIFANSF